MLPRKKITITVPAKRGAFGRALERFREKRKADGRIVRIGFIVDATASRVRTWEEAQIAQGRMVRAVAGIGRVAVRLVHFGGGQLTDYEWSADTRALARKMAAVRCRMGLTQIIPALQLFMEDELAPNAVILVGDAFEEDAAALAPLLASLRARQIRVFAFFDGEAGFSEDIYRKIAMETGGRFARLGDDLPLGDLCEGSPCSPPAARKPCAGSATHAPARSCCPVPMMVSAEGCGHDDQDRHQSERCLQRQDGQSRSRNYRSASASGVMRPRRCCGLTGAGKPARIRWTAASANSRTRGGRAMNGPPARNRRGPPAPCGPASKGA